ncbi:hypothetical protein RP726_17510 [Candidatus Methylospira mobilis]|uniref:hypothetical protein n=1 Tax=Candidatus Methylospira mobilis TaxID=1808979 RepID=UPI001293513B|nr:hypothetical protein [Candidatus Methylospira mobilis]WNV04189.1 hypothetical protein RP726_17510 [Candidatus Methylospira mobilis]
MNGKSLKSKVALVAGAARGIALAHGEAGAMLGCMVRSPTEIVTVHAEFQPDAP